MSKARGLADLGNVYDDGALSNRNLIINGAMQVAQRGTSFSYNSFGGANFCVDRFWFYNGGGATSGTIEQSTDVPSGEGFAYSLFNNTNAGLPSGTNVELTKQGNAAPFVVGNTYTLSFWVKGSSASSGITLQITWRNAHASSTNTSQAVAAYPTFNVTTSWERVVIPFTLNTPPLSQNNVLDFEYSHPAGAKITGVQLEQGDTATPFEHRSYGQELALCQRFYTKSYPADVTPAIAANATEGGFNIGTDLSDTGRIPTDGLRFPVEMRANPTVTLYPGRTTVTATSGYISQYNGNNITAVSNVSAGTRGFKSYIQAANYYDQYSMNYTADAEL